MPCSWAIIPNLSAISRYRGLSVIGKSCGTVGGSPTARSRAPAALGRLRGDPAQSAAFRRGGPYSRPSRRTSSRPDSWSARVRSSTPRALACSATARLRGTGSPLRGIDEEEFLLDAERGMSGHGLKIRSGPSAVLTTGRIGDDGSFAGRCAPRGPGSSVPAPRRNQTCQFEPRPRLVSMAKDFRFGLGLQAARRQQSVQDWGRRAEAMGYDVVHLPDHLYTTAPFPMLTAVAMATETLRVGTFVLNAGFYKPALLARDVSSLRDLSGGRFELGLGAGYVKEEFEQAELPFPTAGQRVDHLRHVTEHMGEHAPGRTAAHRGQRRPAAHHRRATGPHHRADRWRACHRRTSIRWPTASRSCATPHRDRFDDLELNLSIIAMPKDDSGVPDVSIARRFLPGSDRRRAAAGADGAVGVDRATWPTPSAGTATSTASRTSPCSSRTPRRSRR